MKKIFILFLGLGLLLNSCEKYLEEDNRTDGTPDNYYVTADGYQSLVNSVYSQLREIYGDNPNLFCSGTDLYADGRGYNDNGLNDYATLTPQSSNVENLYRECYTAIQLADKALFYAELTLETESLARQIAEVKFIKAFSYFLLVQTYGDVSITEYIGNTPVLSYSRNSEKEVYDLIIADLKDAVAALPDKKYNGTVNLKAAKNLLAKVYLTRAYNTVAGGSTADFTAAANLFDEVIDGQTSLDTDFETLWYPDYTLKDEVIFAIQYSAASQSTDPDNLGNRQYSYFGPYMGGSEFAHSFPIRSYSLVATKLAIDLFEEGDERWDATFMVELFQDTLRPDDNGGYYDYYRVPDHSSLNVYYYYQPKWVDADSLANYRLAHPKTIVRAYGEYHSREDGVYNDFFSIACKKFDDPVKEHSNGERSSTRSIVIDRMGGTFLLAAEAYLGAGNTATALDYVNIVRARAKATPATSVDLDYILDERGRELFGEYQRWFDLKRTGKLVERATEFNPQVDLGAFVGTGGNYKILRPIPQDAIDLNQNPDFKQNPAYE